MCQRIAIIHEDGIVANDPRPAAYAGVDAIEWPNLDLLLDTTFKNGPDQALLSECLANGKSAFAMELCQTR